MQSHKKAEPFFYPDRGVPGYPLVLASQNWPRKSQRNEAYPERAPAHPRRAGAFSFGQRERHRLLIEEAAQGTQPCFPNSAIYREAGWPL